MSCISSSSNSSMTASNKRNSVTTIIERLHLVKQQQGDEDSSSKQQKERMPDSPSSSVEDVALVVKEEPLVGDEMIPQQEQCPPQPPTSASSPPPLYSCSYCDYAVDQHSRLQLHLRMHTGERPFACSHCSYKATQKCNLKKHLQRMHPNEYLIELLSSRGAASGDDSRATAPLLDRVIAEAVFGLGTSSVEDDEVETTNGIGEQVQPQLATNGVSQFNDEGELQPLILYRCPMCNYSTEEYDDWRKHAISHVPQVPKQRWECPFKKFCQFDCESKEALQLHIIATHVHTSTVGAPSVASTKRPAPSPIVSSIPIKSAATPKAEKRPIDPSTPSPPGILASTWEDGMLKRERYHTPYGVSHTVYKCMQCDYSCRSKGRLVIHSRVHSGERPFKCPYCVYASAQKCNITKHVHRKHPIELEKYGKSVEVVDVDGANLSQSGADVDFSVSSNSSPKENYDQNNNNANDDDEGMSTAQSGDEIASTHDESFVVAAALPASPSTVPLSIISNGIVAAEQKVPL